MLIAPKRLNSFGLQIWRACLQGQSERDPLKISRKGGVCKNSLGGDMHRHERLLSFPFGDSKFRSEATVASAVQRKLPHWDIHSLASSLRKCWRRHMTPRNTTFIIAVRASYFVSPMAKACVMYKILLRCIARTAALPPLVHSTGWSKKYATTILS